MPTSRSARGTIPAILRRAAGRLGFAQVISSGFGEVENGQALQQDLAQAAAEGGCRVLGPELPGRLLAARPRHLRGRSAGGPRHGGVITQSGRLGTDIVKRGQWRGLRFSGLVTIGNSADISPTDLVGSISKTSRPASSASTSKTSRTDARFFDLLRLHPPPSQS